MDEEVVDEEVLDVELAEVPCIAALMCVFPTKKRLVNTGGKTKTNEKGKTMKHMFRIKTCIIVSSEHPYFDLPGYLLN